MRMVGGGAVGVMEDWPKMRAMRGYHHTTEARPGCGTSALFHDDNPGGWTPGRLRNGGTPGGDSVRRASRPQGGALVRVVFLLSLFVVIYLLCSCTIADNRMMVAMAASADPVMDAPSRKEVMMAAVQSISDDKAAGRWVMPFGQLGGHFQLNDIATNKKGDPVIAMGADGKVVPVRGGLHVNNEASLKDVGQTAESLMGMWALAKSAVAAASASETASKEATKQLESNNATKLSIENAKASAELEKLKMAEEIPTTPVP